MSPRRQISRWSLKIYGTPKQSTHMPETISTVGPPHGLLPYHPNHPIRFMQLAYLLKGVIYSLPFIYYPYYLLHVWV